MLQYLRNVICSASSATKGWAASPRLTLLTYDLHRIHLRKVSISRQTLKKTLSPLLQCARLLLRYDLIQSNVGVQRLAIEMTVVEERARDANDLPLL